MGRGQQRPEVGDPALVQRGRGQPHPGDLVDHVQGPPPVDLVQGRRQHLVAGRLPQRAAQRRRGALDGGAALRVRAAAHLVAHAAVDEHDREAGGGRVERHLPGRAVAAVQQEGVPGDAAEGRGLVHQPARHAHDVVLRALGEPREGDRVAVDPVGETAERGQRPQRRALDRRRGRQARPLRHIAGQGQLEAPVRRPPPLGGQHRGDPGDVRRPATGLAPPHVGERDLDHRAAGQVERGHPQQPVAAAPHGRRGSLREGVREHEAPGVVDVLADQVHPAGRRPDAVGLAAEDRGEPGGRALSRGSRRHRPPRAAPGRRHRDRRRGRRPRRRSRWPRGT